MKKLKLNTDELRVASFEVAEDASGEGTVRGNAISEGTVTCFGPQCPRTYYVTCIPNCNTGPLC